MLQKKPIRIPVVVFLTSLFIILSILTGLVANQVYQAVTNPLNPNSFAEKNPPSISLVSATPTLTPFEPLGTDVIPEAANTRIPEPNIVKTSTPTPVPTPKLKLIGGGSRINILVMGLDYRDYLAGDIPHSDTMILITIDPKAKTAGMLSIPRDMWVTIPGFGDAKINTAYFLGEINELPGGGPALAALTVEQFLGIKINYYAVINFDAFTSFIDKIGGITLDIPEDIKVTPIGPGHSIVLKAGIQHLFGSDALAYARNRYTALGDFDRANRQQQVILAVRDRVLKASVWPSLLLDAPTLYTELSSGVRTNLTLNQLIQMALIARQIPADQIKHAVIGPDMVTFGVSDTGEDILIPIPGLIDSLRNQIFTNNPPSNQESKSGSIILKK